MIVQSDEIVPQGTTSFKWITFSCIDIYLSVIISFFGLFVSCFIFSFCVCPPPPPPPPESAKNEYIRECELNASPGLGVMWYATAGQNVSLRDEPFKSVIVIAFDLHAGEWFTCVL